MSKSALEERLTSAENKISVRVSFLDCDGMNVVRFPVYLNFVEAGLIELLRGIGYDSGKIFLDRNIAFPVRELTCKYHRPGRFDEILDVVSRISSIGNSSIVTASRVLHNGDLLMECGSVRVCVNVKTGQKVNLSEAFKDLL